MPCQRTRHTGFANYFLTRFTDECGGSESTHAAAEHTSHIPQKPCRTHPDGLSTPVVTALRAQGPRVVIFADDHLPAHVHVFGDGHAKINLIGAGGAPDLVWADGMTRAELRRAMRLMGTHQSLLLARGRAMHGDTDGR